MAAVAGVSLSTASKVLNGGGRVSPETRLRIETAAARLDFRPNALAKFFATGKSQTIGVLISDAPSLFASPVLIGAQSTLGAREMATLLRPSPTELGALTTAVRNLRARQVDGVLVVGDGLARPLPSISGLLDVPVVYALGVSESPADVSYTPDWYGAGVLAANHLHEIGRDKVLHVTGPESDIAARDRERGFREAIHSAGVRLSHPTLHGDWTRGWGIHAAHTLLDAGVDFDGVFCGNDRIATGLHMALREAGRRIPEDVAIIGLDNMSELLRQPDQMITTIDTNLSSLGAAAALGLLTPDIEPGVHYQACSLVTGESTLGFRDVDSSEERYRGA